MLGVEAARLIDDRRIVLFRLFGQLLNGFGRYLRGLFRSDLRCSAFEQRSKLSADSGGQPGTRSGKQMAQDARALLRVRLAKQTRDHLSEGRSLV